MTEEKRYALCFENQDLTHSPKASNTCLNKFKPEDEPSSSKQENCFMPKKEARDCKAQVWGDNHAS